MIAIVSGLPRSGTSVMMRMLAASGLPVLTDALRPADVDNPLGYWEWEPVKQLPREPRLIEQAQGKAVKIISTLLMSLPRPLDARVIFMERTVDQVAASQAAMIRRLGTKGPPLPAAQMIAALEAHRKQVLAWLSARADLALLRIGYGALVESPLNQAMHVREFLDLPVECVPLMAACVDPSLHRQRCPAVKS